MINIDAEDQGLITNTKGTRSKQRQRYCYLLSLLLVFIVAFVSGYVIRMFLSKQKSLSNSPGKENNEKFHDIVIQEIASSKIKENLKGFTSAQHVAGTQDDVKQAKEFIYRKWAESLGKENVELKKYNVLLSYPMKPGKVSIVSQTSGKILFTSKGNETRLWSDEFVDNVVFPFNAYSAAKSVKGKLVYVNYATAGDFELLNTLSISCKGKILIARYGKNFRGNKAALAESVGAIGLILYTDPADYASGKTTYPQSWWMPPDGVQRGTILLDDGDPLTPGYPANENTFRIHENQTSLPNIPVQPISYLDALALIRLLDGREIPKQWKGWKGGLNATYRITMSESSTRYVNLTVSTKRERRDIYNVIGTVKGSIEPDRIIAIGSHHDAWVMGAVDPCSGASVLMEIVRAVGVAVKKGWKPRRTIMFCNWDGEEYGLIGSTEWLEDYKSLIENNIVAYLNSDSTINGNYSLAVKGSAQLANAVFDAAKQVKDPDDSSQSVYEDWRKSFPDKKQPFYPRIRAAGAGSDHRNFYVRYGVPVMDIRYTYNWDDYNHAMSYPVYHSVHDSYHWITSFVDPHFTHHLALGRIWAKLTMALADQQILPFNLSRLAWQLSQCHKSLLAKHGKGFEQHGISLNYLVNSISNFQNATSSFNNFLASLDLNNDLQVRMVNDQLMQVGRSFISREGLPGSPFTKNVVFAPAEHDEYSGSCFPGVTNSLYRVVQKNISDWSSVNEQLSVLSFHILQAARVLTR